MKGAEEGNIRDRLLAYRADRGWSQARTAEESGVAPATIAHIETGANRRPRRITLMKLAQSFGVSLDDFLSDGPPAAPRGIEPGAARLELAKLFDAEPAVRRRALQEATPEEVGRYLLDLERARETASREPDEDDTPDTRRQLVEYAEQLGRMRTEAEIFGGLPHAGVAGQRGA